MIEREIRDRVAIVRLAHGKASAFDTELANGIQATLKELEGSEARAVVLTGTGSIFSAGVDLFKVTGGGAGYLEGFLPALSACFRLLFMYPKPVVAAVNGHAVAGGCILAAACDRRLMARGKGTIGLPELRVGVPFPTMAMELMRFVVPPQHFQEIIYGGHSLSADDALTRGLVDEVVEPDVLLDRAVEIAADLATIPPHTFRMCKRQIRLPVLEAVDRHSVVFEAEVFKLWSSPEANAAIRSYLAKTIGRK